MKVVFSLSLKVQRIFFVLSSKGNIFWKLNNDERFLLRTKLLHNFTCVSQKVDWRKVLRDFYFTYSFSKKSICFSFSTWQLLFVNKINFWLYTFSLNAWISYLSAAGYFYAGEPVQNWWDNDDNQIAFSRGNKAFLAINKADYAMNQSLQTGLPQGSYCNVNAANEGDCSGKSEQQQVSRKGDVFQNNTGIFTLMGRTKQNFR